MIDSHQHIWLLGRNGCEWPTPELAAIYRDFTVQDAMALAQPLGVTGTVLVQSQESDADTDYLLKVAGEHDFVKAVVGWVDLMSPTAEARIDQLARHPKMRGLRPMLQGLASDSWILSPDIESAIRAMKKHSLSLDALVLPRHLPYLRIFAKRHPDLPIVIDHAAKPAIATLGFDQWAEAIGALSDLPNVCCKLSGLVTEAGAEQGIDELRFYSHKVIQLFGSERVMWGSDWPVVNLAPNPASAGYQEWLSMATYLLSSFSELEKQQLFEGTARTIYRF